MPGHNGGTLDATLRVGCVKYLNAQPLIHGWEGNAILDHPAQLCQSLACGQLDVALVSSFEFLRNPIYRIVDNVSISSDGAVYSVFVANVDGMARLKEIELDPAAETSVNLLRCLLAEFGFSPRLVEISSAKVTPGRGRLLIGDQAIHFRQLHERTLQFWDLGQQWQRLAGLPFVYALWLVRPEVANPTRIAGQLRRLRDKNLADVVKFASQTENPEFCARYYQEHLRFSFGTAAKQGLRMFQRLCQKHGLVPNRELNLELV